MTKLTSKQRSDLSSSTFAGPDRSYPIPDKSHAEAAIRDSARGENAGNITAAQRQTIVQRAKTKLRDVK
jgi:hypothetical protein